ncbi:MAG: hypothetical protein LBQ88_16305 [Treponema sp.]|nr:hypothetical protein [Treponema sp.]
MPRSNAGTGLTGPAERNVHPHDELEARACGLRKHPEPRFHRRKGTCWDNAHAESFFKTPKRELETLEGRHSVAEIRQSVFV